MDKLDVIKTDDLEKVSGGVDTDAQTPPVSPDALKQAAEAMLRQGEANPSVNPLDLLNG